MSLMKVALLSMSLVAALFSLAGCNYVKPVMYVQIVNRSGHPLRNLEVKHPAGIFGLPELGDEQTHRHMLNVGTPCRFSIAFEDQTGKPYRGNFDLGAKCPTEVAFAIGPGMQVSETPVRP
jgi:hypothetical protein